MTGASYQPFRSNQMEAFRLLLRLNDNIFIRRTADNMTWLKLSYYIGQRIALFALSVDSLGSGLEIYDTRLTAGEPALCR